MTHDSPSTTRFETLPRVASEAGVRGHARIAELDRVTIGREIAGDEGELIPSGSSGTVVAVWSDGAAYEVEFLNPVSALATVEPDAISAHHPRRSR